jgi:hypothetical protein
MSVPRGPSFQPFARVGAPPRPKDAQILAVGRRALVTRAGSRSARVTLTDEGGTNALGTIADGTEVEILAWRPRRGDTRYRVASRDGGLEGWVDAGNLTPVQPPPPPTMAAPAAPSGRTALPIPPARGTPPPPRRSPPPVAGASAKAAARAARTTRVGTR